MTKNVFRSKSRVLALDEVKKAQEKFFSPPALKKVKVFTSVKSNFIAWIGRNLPKGDVYGFKNLDISKSDVSILVDAKLLVVHCTNYSGRVGSVVNFAFEYGVPILWVNYGFPPKDKAWFFKKVSKDVYWELICQMAE